MIWSIILAVLCTQRVQAGVLDVQQATPPGTNCTSEGLYQCIQQTQFQQCRWGSWSQIGIVEQGSNCDFHGEIGYMASALMPANYSIAPGSRRRGLKPRVMPRSDQQVPGDNAKRDSSTADITSSPLYHENDEGMQRPGKRSPSQLGPSGGSKEHLAEAMIDKRDGNSLVAEPRTPADTCSSNKRSTNVERALRYPTYVVCGVPPDSISVLQPSDITAARQRAVKARMYSYNNYPKEFGNYENRNMNGCRGQLFEFPVLVGGLYGNDDHSWAPGPDRIIIDCSGNLCAVLTHTGAPPRNRNAFYECSYYY